METNAERRPIGGEALTAGGHPASSMVTSSTGGVVPVPCPACGDMPARRSHRSGPAEKLLSALYVYPFRCRLCGHRFFALQWGIRYHRTSPDPSVAGMATPPGPFSSLP
jgi:hypothetical protein